MDEIKLKLHGAKYFTKLDLTNAVYHIMLGEKSRELTTFLGPSGMFRFKRLVFGVNCAPEMFQQTMEHLTEHFRRSRLIFSDNLQSLKITENVKAALKANNLTINDKNATMRRCSSSSWATACHNSDSTLPTGR